MHANPRGRRRQRACGESVHSLFASAALSDDPGNCQSAKVKREHRSRDLERLIDFARAERTHTQEIDDSPPRRIDNGAKNTLTRNRAAHRNSFV